MKSIFSCPEHPWSNKENDQKKSGIWIVLYTLSKHFHIHFFSINTYDHLLVYNRKSRNHGDLVQDQTARQGDNWRQHPGCMTGPAFSTRSRHGALSSSHHLCFLLTLHKHAACQLQRHRTENTDFKRRKTTNPFFDKNTQMS